MPKRTREDEPKPAPRLSAIAQRRLRSAQESPAAPAPAPPPPATPVSTAANVRKLRSALQRRHEETIVPATSASNDEISRKRAELERKVSEHVKAIQAMKDDPMVQFENWSSSGASSASKTPPCRKDSPGGKSEESALARIKRRRGEEEEEQRSAATDDDDDVEMHGIGEDEAIGSGAESSTPKVLQVSSFVLTEENHIATNSSVTFRLRPGETLVLVGIYKINVTKGSITISGATLSEASPIQTIYAPMTSALPVIEAPLSKRKKSTNDQNPGAEIQITSHHSGILGVGKLCSTSKGIWRGPSKEQTPHSFSPILTSTNAIPTISIPASWKPTLASLSKKATSDGRLPVILLTGAKGTGKSTFSRIIANHLLTSAGLESLAYLDVDPGQPEFSPPGIISLNVLTTPILGPAYTHTTAPVRSHHIGYTSPREDPGHYMACIIDLLTLYRHSYQTLPLLINTAGWTKGLGLELLQGIFAHSQASDVIFLGSGGQNTVAEIIPPHTATLYELSSAVTTGTRFSPADLRTLHTMCHFHWVPKLGDWDFSTPLTGLAPWVVPYTGSERGVDGIEILGETLAEEELRTAVEGTIVAVVLVADHILLPLLPATTTNELPPLLTAALTPDVTECRGLAVVRAFDTSRRCIQLLWAGGGEEVERWEGEGLRVVLVRGRLEIAAAEMVVPGAGDGGEVPWVSSGEGKRVGGAVWRVRRNVMRRGHQ